MGILAALLKLHLRIVYRFMKMGPSAGKVCFLSWQTDEPSVDFLMLERALKEWNPDVKTKVLTKRMKRSVGGILSYYFHMYRQMYHMAGSSVLVIDSYVPAVSILNHREDLCIIQLWHALGAIKKFGLQTVGKEGGRSSKLGKYFHMHRNYSVIISSSEKTSVHYGEAFGYPLNHMHVCGLPRIDYLYNNKEEIRDRILAEYPRLSGTKRNILYAPTFRNSGTVQTKSLIDSIDHDSYNLIIKPHERQQSIYSEDERVISPKRFSSMEILTVTDLLITDYSAISLEAAVLGVPILYYLYDYEEYKEKNGLNIDIYDIFKKQVFTNPEELKDLLSKWLRGEESDGNDILRNDYLPPAPWKATECIRDIICRNLK